MSESATGTFLYMKASRSDYGSQFEILVSLIFHSIVRPGDIVVDGGANAGLHTIPLANLVGADGLVIAVEPIPSVFARLAQQSGTRPVELHQAALGDKPGKCTFVINEPNAALSHVKHHRDKLSVDEKEITVECVTLDGLVASRKITFIKLDLEGFDFVALRGASNILSDSRPAVVFENSRRWAAECYGYTCDEFFEFFDSLGYSIFDLHGRHFIKECWNDNDIAFEFIAVPEENANIQELTISIIKYFWANVDDRPTIPSWAACVAAVRNVDDYMTRFHGKDWLKALHKGEESSI